MKCTKVIYIEHATDEINTMVNSIRSCILSSREIYNVDESKYQQRLAPY